MTKGEIQAEYRLGASIPEILTNNPDLTYNQVYTAVKSDRNYDLDEARLLREVTDNNCRDIERLAKIGRCSYNQAREWYYKWVREQLNTLSGHHKITLLAQVYNVSEQFIYKNAPTSLYKFTAWESLLERILDGSITKSEAHRESGCSRATIDRRLRQYVAKASATTTGRSVQRPGLKRL